MKIDTKKFNIKKIEVREGILLVEGLYEEIKKRKEEIFNQELGIKTLEEKEIKKEKPIKIRKRLNIDKVYIDYLRKNKTALKNVVMDSLSKKMKEYSINLKDKNGYPKSEKEVKNEVKNTIKALSSNLNILNYYTSYYSSNIEKLIIWYLDINDYDFNRSLIKYFKNFLEKKIGKFINYIKLYEDYFFLNLEKVNNDNLINIPYIIGTFNKLFYKYSLENPIIDFKNKKISFQDYFKNENFVVYGLTYSNKQISELKKEDFVYINPAYKSKFDLIEATIETKRIINELYEEASKQLFPLIVEKVFNKI